MLCGDGKANLRHPSSPLPMWQSAAWTRGGDMNGVNVTPGDVAKQNATASIPLSERLDAILSASADGSGALGDRANHSDLASEVAALKAAHELLQKALG